MHPLPTSAFRIQPSAFLPLPLELKNKMSILRTSNQLPHLQPLTPNSHLRTCANPMSTLPPQLPMTRLRGPSSLSHREAGDADFNPVGLWLYSRVSCRK